jgi:hypothetical protein
MGVDTQLEVLEAEQVDAVATQIEQENAAEAEKKAKRGPGRSSDEWDNKAQEWLKSMGVLFLERDIRKQVKRRKQKYMMNLHVFNWCVFHSLPLAKPKFQDSLPVFPKPKMTTAAAQPPKAKQFTDKDKPAQVRISNIIAAKGERLVVCWAICGVVCVFDSRLVALADAIRTSLGPRGMDKMVVFFAPLENNNNMTPLQHNRFNPATERSWFRMTVQRFSRKWPSCILPPKWYVLPSPRAI